MRSRSATTFGRDDELRQLLALADKARSGESISVLVHGEAGVGKTRLVSDLVAGLREQDDIVFLGHGVNLAGGEVPFGVLAESLRELVRTVGASRVREALGKDAEQLAPLVPALRSGAHGEADRALVISATADLVEALAADRLVCWVVEDLQWTDTATRDAFTFMSRFLPSARLLMAATWRDEDGGPPPPADVTEAVALHPLAGVDLGALVAEVTPGLDTPDRERVAELSQGLPFLVEEVVDSWRPGVGVDPAYLRRLVLTRLPDLSPAARVLVELAAVGEGHLDVRLLEEGLGVDPAAIREAADAGILERGPGEGTLRFRHALLREAIADATPPGDRRRLHRRWAEAIEADDAALTDESRVVELAAHWHGAHVPEKALPALAEAARRAHRVPAPTVEQSALTKILEWWDRVPDPEGLTGLTRARALVDTVHLGMITSSFDRVHSLLEAELERAGEEDDPVALAWARLRMSVFDDNFRTTIPRPDLAEALLAGDVDDPRVVDGLLLVADAGPSEDMTELVRSSLERVRDAGADPASRFAATLRLSVLHQRAGQFEQTLARVREQRARLSGTDLAEEWLLAAHEAWLLILLGRAAEAIPLLEGELGRVSRPSTLSQRYQTLAENLAHSYFCVGRWDGAVELATSALAVAPELGDDDTVVLVSDYLRMLIVDVLVARGDLPAARITARPVEGHAGPDPWGDRVPEAETLAQLAALSAAEGDLTRCRAELAGAWDLAPSPALSEQLPRAALTALRAESSLVDRHDPAAAAESAALVDRIMATAARLSHPGPRGAAWWAEAQAHAARSRGGDTAADWAPAVAGWRECGQPYDVATCLRYLGEACLGDGDATAASAALAEAYDICVELGARPIGDTVLTVARRGRLPVGPTTPRSGPGPLTAREIEVLGLVSAGRSNQQIASELFMSPKTVSVHVSRILTKLDA
ncbi:MAG TPA: AAA family ATPase, partial [Nocardioides sp.]|nr:AAA family ATPase [Nocardioides sp.]